MMRLPGRMAPAFPFGPDGQPPSAFRPARTAERKDVRSCDPRDECSARSAAVSAAGAAGAAADAVAAGAAAGALSARDGAESAATSAADGRDVESLPVEAEGRRSSAGASAQASAAAQARSDARRATVRHERGDIRLEVGAGGERSAYGS